MDLTQQTDCPAWQFDGIPAFTGGKMHPLFADCGAGLSPIPDTETADHSFMHLFRGAKKEDILSYTELLVTAGFEKIYEHSTDGDLFYQFSVRNGLLYISFLKDGGVARFILDQCRQTDVPAFGYSVYTDKRDDTVLAQYSLHYDAMIRGVTCDCGMNYVYRLRDNTLIIIDGGEMEQATDSAAADYMAFLHELTDTAPGEKMTVALWICTHAHNDHCDFFSKLLRFYGDELTVERAAFNFPLSTNVRHSPSVQLAKERLLQKYPDIAYIKPHAGCKFSIANAEIEVLVSNEDTTACDDEDVFPGTNDTSMIFTVTADGVKTLFLADCGWDNGDVLIRNFGSDTLSCRILQAAHHGINEIFEVYDCISAEKVLLPQCRMNMDTRFQTVYANLCRLYGEDNILFANDATDIFICKDGRYSIRKRNHVGTAWDHSEW